MSLIRGLIKPGPQGIRGNASGYLSASDHQVWVAATLGRCGQMASDLLSLR